MTTRNDSDDIDAHSFTWRVLRKEEAPVAHAVHIEALSGQAAGLVRPDELSHFMRHMGEEGLLVGCFIADGQMVAYGVLGTASKTVSHMAELLEIDEADHSRFCVLDGVAALTAWRGYGMHRESIKERLRHAGQLGHTLVGATVAPGNIPSMRGLFEARFQVKKFSMLYGGLSRLVLKKDLKVAEPDWVLQHRVAATDEPGHQSALKEGLTGFGCSQREDGVWQVHYGIEKR
ncbi:hypothetical protein [Noviherbaspirillum sp.]|uniref:hypothetical protein n=1 Tax=Noviherbaspirillum sp. TaxID=1926288 RepID=UPI002FDFDF97